MTQPVLLKIYGHIYPATSIMFTELEKIAKQAMPVPDCSVINIKDNLLTISFEGIWFPADEMIKTIQTHLKPEQTGKLDIIDIDAWMLTRYQIHDSSITHSSAHLNNVLAYSGH